MKSEYTKPMVEKIEFDYQIATASSGGYYVYSDQGDSNCNLILLSSNLENCHKYMG